LHDEEETTTFNFIDKQLQLLNDETLIHRVKQSDNTWKQTLIDMSKVALTNGSNLTFSNLSDQALQVFKNTYTRRKEQIDRPLENGYTIFFNNSTSYLESFTIPDTPMTLWFVKLKTFKSDGKLLHSQSYNGLYYGGHTFDFTKHSELQTLTLTFIQETYNSQVPEEGFLQRSSADLYVNDGLYGRIKDDFTSLTLTEIATYIRTNLTDWNATVDENDITIKLKEWDLSKNGTKFKIVIKTVGGATESQQMDEDTREGTVSTASVVKGYVMGKMTLLRDMVLDLFGFDAADSIPQKLSAGFEAIDNRAIGKESWTQITKVI
jgi:hypothetical protein